MINDIREFFHGRFEDKSAREKLNLNEVKDHVNSLDENLEINVNFYNLAFSFRGQPTINDPAPFGKSQFLKNANPEYVLSLLEKFDEHQNILGMDGRRYVEGNHMVYSPASFLNDSSEKHYLEVVKGGFFSGDPRTLDMKKPPYLEMQINYVLDRNRQEDESNTSGENQSLDDRV